MQSKDTEHKSHNVTDNSKTITNIEEAKGNKKKSTTTGSTTEKAPIQSKALETNARIQVIYSSAVKQKCTRCKYNKKGYYLHLCAHMFICETCIMKCVIAKILLEGIMSFCDVCKAPVNTNFIIFIAGKGDRYLHDTIRNWNNKNTRQSVCCREHAVKTYEAKYYCTKCGLLQ
eukprot:TRINITY_DN8511_c0_g1_i1.p1 TRINITY_DN8511_c0_g1~~TRINITY_DN8511_c0_g1_i1.p1  ORF type:complete len:173 (+),score=7.57 TRINITY_DN8511_c0_g1_i1:338-856(+)